MEEPIIKIACITHTLRNETYSAAVILKGTTTTISLPASFAEEIISRFDSEKIERGVSSYKQIIYHF